jgi:predicted transglutaminase-like cysteine proteinase
MSERDLKNPRHTATSTHGSHAGSAAVPPLTFSVRSVFLLWIFAAFTIAVASTIVIDQKVLQNVEMKYGKAARLRVTSWDDLMKSDRNMPETEKLKLVNRFFNEMRFVDDIIHWKKADYWASPIEFLGTNGGDCEDFAVAKYFTLRQLGVPDDRLRITYVKALKLNQAHMVLTYYKTPASEPLVLDNLVPDIRPASRRQDLFPVYSFNGDGLWLAKQRGTGKMVGKSSKIKHWTDLLKRMKTITK